MIRDDKGRFAPSVEMTDEQREAICYKSKLLNKYFDTYQDLVAAEEEFKAKESAKNKALEEKKQDAKKVEDAYKHALEVRKEANAKVTAAEQAYYDARREFVKKYGSFHMTYTNKDDVATISTLEDFINELFKVF